MTPDERNMLNDLADKIAQTPAAPRDPEAEDIVRTKIGKRPDALYLMTQTVLIQNLALQRAQQQLQSLQRGGPGQTPGGSSWLGQGGGSYSGGGNQPQYAAPAPSYAQAPAGLGSGGGSSFLRGAAQTAAGVAAGTLAAEAIGSMFSHGGGMFGGGSNFLGGGTGAPTEEIVNNYYDSPGGSDSGSNQGNDFVDPGANDDSSRFDDNSAMDDNSSMLDDNTGFDSGDGGGFDDNLV